MNVTPHVAVTPGRPGPPPAARGRRPGIEDVTVRANVGGAIVPLTERARALAGLRALITVAVLMLCGAGGEGPTATAVAVALGYLALTGLLGLAVFLPSSTIGLRAFGFALLVDAVYLQYLLIEYRHTLGVQVAIAAFLVGVTLLASFRTGIKIAVWISILLVVTHQAQVNGLIATPGGPPQQLSLVSDLVMMWIVVVTASTAAAINERELRRRRYDTEVLRQLATQQHRFETPEEVLGSLLTFIHAELDASRVLMCRESQSGLEVLAGIGLAPAPGTDGLVVPGHRIADSALLSMVGADPVLVLRLDPARDPWLDERMPGATKLIAVQVARSEEPVYLVVELSGHSTRVERRVVGTLEQAAATTALALSRAELLVQARRSASTDGLTGAWNRRTFDAELAAGVARCRADGTPVSLIMVDVDHFKKVNDVHGHQIGDEVLILVARTLADVLKSLGGVGTAYRYGGEEFSVLLPGGDAALAAKVGEQLRASLQALQGPVPVTASFGVAEFGPDVRNEAELLLHADAALLQAKQNGRNQVRVFEGATTLAAAQVPPQRLPDGVGAAG